MRTQAFCQDYVCDGKHAQCSAEWPERLGTLRFRHWGGAGERPTGPKVSSGEPAGWRFLILPWVGVSFLASHGLGLVSRRIGRDWIDKYGHGLDWLETFVDAACFEGSSYAAANWLWVGDTQGRGRQDPQHQRLAGRKKVFVYPVGASTNSSGTDSHPPLGEARGH